MKLQVAIAAVAVAKQVEDDAAMLSVAAIHDSLQPVSAKHRDASFQALIEAANTQEPRRAAELIQEFALNKADSAVSVDASTRERLIVIRDILTNETYTALEQAHRRDQDLLDKHARAINECGLAHSKHLQMDIEGQEVNLVRDTEDTMYACRGFPEHSESLMQKPERYWSNWTGVNDPKFSDPNFKSLQKLKVDMVAKCDALDEFVRGIPLPNCIPPLDRIAMASPSCNSQPMGVDSDLTDWLTNMKENARFYQGQWRELRSACNAARQAYDELDDTCDRKQRMFEQSFCSYRQGLHATCAEYQGCHVLNEEQYKELVKTVMYNADSRKIDWKAIHKIECYINVLISEESNTVRAEDLLNCEAGNLNTIETILTGFNETNYLSLIVPEINVSCWDIEIPQYIDFKECDMSSVSQFPCSDKWMDRYNGIESPEQCGECAPLPDGFQYHMEQDHSGVKSDKYGGGWYFVNELGRDNTDINDLTSLAPGGYHLPEYMTGNLRWNEVLVERVSANWCDSWGTQTGYWAEDGGASMCVQSDNQHVYCMNNKGGGHSWRRQPVSHFTSLCGGKGRPECECWPKKKEICWAYSESATGPTQDNVEAPDYIKIRSMKDDGSVVKISFQGEEKEGILRVGNYNAFVQDAEGCRAITPVRYRVYVRCLGCSATNETDFHTKDGMHFLEKMHIGHMAVTSRTQYTYEAWFKSPLDGHLRREIFGGASTGFTLVNEGAVKCLHDVGVGIAHGHKHNGYQLHVGSTDKYSSLCFEPDTFYHVAVSRDNVGAVRVYVNGKEVTAQGHRIDQSEESTLASTLGGGFTDGGQLFNVRIWNYARTQVQLYQDAFVTNIDAMSDIAGLAHWWPLSKDLKDVITGVPLTGPEVRYAPVWCSDLEASGMCGC